MQVLGNLLSNAARQSPESSAIRVSAVRQGVHVAVSVADEGRGIPADRLPHLFRKFSRIDAEDQGGATPASAWRSAGDWWRLTGDASGPRAKGLGWAPRFTFTLPAAGEAASVGPEAFPGRTGQASAAGRRPAAEPGGGRRPSDAQVRAGRALQGGLLADGDRRPG